MLGLTDWVGPGLGVFFFSHDDSIFEDAAYV